MREWLEEARGKRYVGVAELAQEAARILRESGAAQQARGTVTELPDERTVRYYLTEGLVAPAEEKQGTASVFGFRQLLQLLVVKKLQAEHLSIRAIRELVAGKGERQLEKLLGLEHERGAGKGEALRYLESLLKKGGQANSASSPPQSFAPSQPSRVSSPGAPQPAASRETWARVELEPGLELHVSEGYDAPQDEGALSRLMQSFINVLRARGTTRARRGRR